MKMLLAVFVLLSLVLNAAPNLPTLHLDCTTTTNGCAATLPVTFGGTSYNPHKTYVLDGSSPENPTETFSHHGLVPDANGNISDWDFLPAGNWTFIVSVEAHDGTAQKTVATALVIFE